ncbi:MAG: 2OG-Fe(II) oxygenase [Steroidobacteraceae bacterium]
MTLRDNVLIQHGAIDAEALRFLNDEIRSAGMTDSLVSNFEGEAEPGVVEWVINKRIRDTQEVQLPAGLVARLDAVLDSGVQRFINPFYRVEVRDREPPQVLHYGSGGHYIPHVDAETLFKDDAGLDLWEKSLDRDLSVVCFLNDDFAGGELVFPGLDLTIKPQAGTLVCFPADHNYIHGVNPVTAGHRYTLVTWMRVHGMPTMDEINDMTMAEYHRCFPNQIEQPSRLAKGGLAPKTGKARG